MKVLGRSHEPALTIAALIARRNVQLSASVNAIITCMKVGIVLPAFLGRIHPRFRTAAEGTVVMAAAAALIAALLPISLLAQMVSIGALSAFIAVAGAVLRLRRTCPLAHRPLRTPFMPFVPMGAIFACGYMVLGLPPATWFRFGLWLALGLSIYYALYGRRSEGRPCNRSNVDS